jgi:hypothetical protein
MKLYQKLSLLTVIVFSNSLFSQDKVGIGVTVPTEALSISKGLNIDHNNENDGTSLLNGLRFGNTAVATQMVGICSNRIGLAPLYTMDFYTNNTRRMIILQNGWIGIGGIIPTLYNLEVNGTIRTTGNLRSDFDVLANDDVIANGTIIAGANISAGTNISATNDITAGGDLTANGRGVIMNNGVARMKYATFSATLTVTNLPAEGTVTGAVAIPGGTFTGTPTAYVGNVTTENGEYYKALIVLENVTATNVTVRVVNPTANPITFANATWKIVVVGPY